MTGSSEGEIRDRLAALKKKGTTFRDLAAHIGISHFAIYRFLEGKSVRPATLESIRIWLEHPGEEEAVQELRRNLRRLAGRLGAKKLRELEGSLGRALAEAFEEAGEEVPVWVKKLGRKQV